MRASAGVHDFAAKVVSTTKTDGSHPPQFLPHLRMLGNSLGFRALIGQNSAGEYNDDLGRKLIELYLACCLSHFAKDLALDDPDSSKGDNPDILFRPDLSKVEPVLWTMAIKTLGSTQGQTMFENIKKAGAQINSRMCKAERGVVLLNSRNVLDHARLWNTQFNDLDTAFDALQSELIGLKTKFMENRSRDEWSEAVGGKVRQPVLILGHTLVSLPWKDGGRVATQIRGLAIVDGDLELDADAMAIAEALNAQIQKIV